MTIPVVYEDEHILAINKPAGLTVHKTHPSDPNETLADMLARERPYLVGVGENPLRPGIVHRLDKDTSGIMLVAKDQPTFEYLKRQFQDRLVRKEYLALVHGAPKQKRGTIDAPLGKLGTKQTTQIKGKREIVERNAITDYEVIKMYGAYTLLQVMPHTGRTHQIRVHLKSIGCPVVGDKIYGPAKALMPHGLHRLFLHAQRISFTTPDDKSLTLEVDLPEDLQNVLSVLQ